MEEIGFFLLRRSLVRSVLFFALVRQSAKTSEAFAFAIFNIACGLIFEETVKLQEVEQTTDCVSMLGAGLLLHPVAYNMCSFAVGQFIASTKHARRRSLERGPYKEPAQKNDFIA